MIPDDIILLSAPLELRDIGPPLKNLHQACQTGDLHSAIVVWGHLDDWRYIDQIPSELFEAISLFLTGSFALRNGRPLAHDIANIATSRPDQFGRVVQMATEAAARDHWHGLYRMMLALLAAGRPLEAAAAFERYQTAMRRVQGKEREDLSSWDREKRLAARMDGESATPITLLQVAALTMTDQLDSPNIITLFGANLDLRKLDDVLYGHVRDALASSPYRDKHLANFKSNYMKVGLAMSCYHPDALRERIRYLSRNHNLEELLSIYDKILSATLGPARFLQPLDLDSLGAQVQRQDNITMPPEVWRKLLGASCDRVTDNRSSGTFIHAFTFVRRPDKIIDMIEIDLPARGLRPNASIIALAMRALSVLSREDMLVPSRDMREVAYSYACSYLGHVHRFPDVDRDDVIDNRIRTLAALGRISEVNGLYQEAQNGRLKMGPLAQGALIHASRYLIGHPKKIERALDIIRQHTRLTSFSPPNGRTYFEFVKLVVREGSIPLWRRYSAFVEAMKLKPKDVVLDESTLGLILVLTLNVGNDAEEYFDAAFRELRGGQQRPNSIVRWKSAVEAMLSHFRKHHQANLDEILTVLTVLEEIAGGTVEGVNRTRAKRLWELVCRSIATSTSIGARDRRRCIDRALSLYPKHLGSLDETPYFNIIESCLSRCGSLGRTDEDGVAEAMFRFEEMRRIYHPLHPLAWVRMLQALNRSKRLDRAKELIADASRQPMDLGSDFWRLANALGLTERAGVTGSKQTRGVLHEMGKVADEGILDETMADSDVNSDFDDHTIDVEADDEKPLL